MNFSMGFSVSVKNAVVILIRITLNEHIIILTMFSLPVHEHGIPFHLFRSSLISFSNVTQLLMYKSFASLVKFIPKYFFLFDYFCLISQQHYDNSHYLYQATVSIIAVIIECLPYVGPCSWNFS